MITGIQLIRRKITDKFLGNNWLPTNLYTKYLRIFATMNNNFFARIKIKDYTEIVGFIIESMVLRLKIY
jgi:hypothetical protein